MSATHLGGKKRNPVRRSGRLSDTKAVSLRIREAGVFTPPAPPSQIVSPGFNMLKKTPENGGSSASHPRHTVSATPVEVRAGNFWRNGISELRATCERRH